MHSVTTIQCLHYTTLTNTAAETAGSVI